MTDYRKERIGVFREYLLPYSETFIINQIRFIKNFDTELLGLNVNSFTISDIRIESINTKGKMGEILFKYLGIIEKSSLNKIRQRRYKLIHAHFGPDSLIALKLSEKEKIPLISTFHGYDVYPMEKNLGFFYKYYEKNRRKLFKRSRKIIAVSEFIKERLIKLGCEEKKIVVHYIGIDVDYFSSAEDKEKENTILYVGRIIKQKGIFDLIDAIKLLYLERDDFKLKVVGEGNAKLDAITRSSGLPVEFLGRKEPAEIKTLMSQAKIFCMPSMYEALGTVYAEAQSMQIPVVAYKHGGVPEIVKHGVSGLLSEVGDIKSLAQNIQELLYNEEKRQKMGRLARKNIEENYNIKVQSALLEKIYTNVIKEEDE